MCSTTSSTFCAARRVPAKRFRSNSALSSSQRAPLVASALNKSGGTVAKRAAPAKKGSSTMTALSKATATRGVDERRQRESCEEGIFGCQEDGQEEGAGEKDGEEKG